MNITEMLAAASDEDLVVLAVAARSDELRIADTGYKPGPGRQRRWRALFSEVTKRGLDGRVLGWLEGLLDGTMAFPQAFDGRNPDAIRRPRKKTR